MEFREGDDADLFSGRRDAAVTVRDIGWELIQTINARNVHQAAGRAGFLELDQGSDRHPVLGRS
jgi:hypothetical protein